LIKKTTRRNKKMAGKNDWIANGKWIVSQDEEKKIMEGKKAEKVEIEIHYFEDSHKEGIINGLKNLVQKHFQLGYGREIEKVKGVQPNEYGKQYPKEL